MIAYLQETWKLQKKVTYRGNTYLQIGLVQEGFINNLANTTVGSLIKKFAKPKDTGKERPGMMTDSARKHIHISHSVTNVFAFKFQNGKMELGR